jgi:hypothetical protein
MDKSRRVITLVIQENQEDVTPSEKDLFFRALMVLIGFGLAVSGGTTAIMYLNLLAVGFTSIEYFEFILDRPECYLFPGGILITWLSIYFPENLLSNRK